MLTESKNAEVLGVPQQLANEIGQRLKTARNEQGRSMQQVSKRIKVQEQYLQAIEAGLWQQLPPGLNGRGLVRNYAKELAVALPELEPAEIKNHMSNQVHPYEVSTATVSRDKLPTSREHVNSHRVAARSSHKSIPRHPIEVAPPLAPENQIKKQNNLPFSESDDDTPLEIVTPDVARILGLPTDNSPKNNDLKPREELADQIPSVDANSIVSDLIKADGVQKPVSQKKSQKERRHREEFKPQKTEGQRPPEPVKEAVAYVPPELIYVKTNKSPVVAQEPVVARPDPSIPTMLVKEHQKDLESRQDKGQRKLFFAAAAVLVVATGAYVLIRQNRSSLGTESLIISQPVAPAPQTEVQSIEPVTEPGLESVDEVQSAEVEEVPTSLEEPVVTAESAMPTAEPTSAPVTVNTERTAVLKLSDSVDMRIVIDDKVYFTGTKAAGDLPLSFKDKAEIFVKDGSKVSLVYEGWEHGLLGHEGRRRRIILSAHTAE